MFKEEDQGKGMSYYIISYTLGYFGGISIGGYMAYYFGIRSGFLISGILSAISGILVLILFKEDQHLEQSSSIFKNNVLKSNFNLSNIKLLLKNRQFEIVTIISSIRWLIFGGIVAYIIWVLQVQFELNTIQTSYILILTVAIYILFVGISGKIIENLGHKKTMLLGQAIIILLYQVSKRIMLQVLIHN